MNITLYRDCPIPDDYNVVWNSATTFGSYSDAENTAHKKLLDSLSKTTITIPDIYLDDEGEIILDLEDTNNAIWYIDFNYMSYEIQRESGNEHKMTRSITGPPGMINSMNLIYLSNGTITNEYIFFGDLQGYLTRNQLKHYAFITKVEYFNDCIKIHYKADIWSTYSPWITSGTGTTVRFSEPCLYQLSYNTILTSIAQEEDLFSNSALKKYNLSGSTIASSLTGNQQCYCFATVQYYTLDAQGKQTDRRLDSTMIAYGSSSTIGDFSKNSFIATVDEWNAKIVQLMTYQSVGLTVSIPAQNYEIQDIYLIPLNLCTVTGDYNFDTWLDNLFNGQYPLLWLYSISSIIEYNNSNYYYLMSLAGYCDNSSYPGKTALSHSFEITSGSINNEFKRAGIGFYTHMIPVECNNPLTKFNYSIRFSFDCCNINIYLECMNKIIEVTEDLAVKIPIQVATADATQLQAIQRSIANKKNISSGVFGAVKGIGTSVVGGVLGGAIGGGAIASGILNTAQSITNAVLDDKLINAKAYTSNKSIDANSVGYLNAYYGLLNFEIDPINSDEVKTINIKKGYIYNTPINVKIDSEPLNHYDLWAFYPLGISLEAMDQTDVISRIGERLRYLRMKDVFIKGFFSYEIRNKLKSIIETGFRFVTSKHATNYERYL